METTLVPQIVHSLTFNDLVKKAESYEAVRKHGRISTTLKPAGQATTPPVPNPSRNHRSDRKTDNKKTSSKPGRTPATKTTTNKDPDWEVVDKTLTSQDKMKLITERKCLLCRAPGHTFKECKNRISKVLMRTAVQVLSIKRRPVDVPRALTRSPLCHKSLTNALFFPNYSLPHAQTCASYLNKLSIVIYFSHELTSSLITF